MGSVAHKFELPGYQVTLLEFWREYIDPNDKVWVTLGDAYEDYQCFCDHFACHPVGIDTFVREMKDLGAIFVQDGHHNVYMLLPMQTYWDKREPCWFLDE